MCEVFMHSRLTRFVCTSSSYKFMEKVRIQ
jgi:hypothetical protein